MMFHMLYSALVLFDVLDYCIDLVNQIFVFTFIEHGCILDPLDMVDKDLVMK